MIRQFVNRLLLYLTPRINQLPASTNVGPNGSALHRIRQHYVYRIAAEMKTWRTAIVAAENPQRPDRRLLYALYREIELDDQVTTQLRIAKATVTNAPFEVMRDGQTNEELQKIFQRPWFEDYLRWSVDTEFWGHSLLEFDPKMMNGEFRNLYLIPRDHVKPEYGEVTVYTNDEKGFEYRGNRELKYLLELGRPWDLGLYRIVAVPVIRKRYADTDWSLFSEKYGMPFLTIKTASRQKNELDAKEEMARNFGANGWAILDDQDDIGTLFSNYTGTGHNTFKDRMLDSDDRIAKIINGQTGASDEKAWVGSAEVHERILNDFVKARLTNIQYHINFQLLPFLASHGYPVANCEFEFTELRRAERAERPTTSDQADEGQQLGAQKKSLALSIAELYGSLRLPDEVQRLAFQPVPTTVGLGLAVKVHRGDLRAGQVDPDLFQAYSRTLLQALADGADEDLAGGLDYRHRDYDLFRRLRRSAWEFSVAKALRLTGELAAKAARGGTFQEYNDFAEPRIRRHHGEWLETEYRLGVANTQQAIKWQDIEERKGALPMLRYVTARDERVRDSHALLHGATYPVDDPFWDKYYPPNGYNCRCTTQQVAGPQRDAAGIPDDVPAPLQDNPGKSGRLFSRRHPYFQEAAPEDISRHVNRLAAALPVFDLVYDGKAKVYAHPVKNPDEQNDNELIARKLADAGEEVRLLPYHSEDGRKSPDAQVGGLVVDFKTTGPTRASIQNAVRRGRDQGVNVTLLYFRQEYDRNTLRRALLAGRGWGYYQDMEVWVVMEGGRTIKISKEELQSGKLPL